MKEKIIFMGSPDFALPSLQSLHNHYEVCAVITQPDRKAGRGKTLTPPPVKRLALELGLEVYQPASLRPEETVDRLRGYNPDVIVVAAFGQILRKNVLELPPHGCVNVHASLLPRWRGASPINAAILHGDPETGVTLMKMDVGLDTGPMIASEAIPIPADISAGVISDQLAQLGGQMLIEYLPKYLAGEITPTPQDDSLSTYAPMLKKSDGELDFTRKAKQLARQVQAYHPWPGSFTTWKGKPLKIHRATAAAGKSRTPGKHAVYNSRPAIHTADGLLVLDILQPAGKKRMDGDTFLNGAQDWAQK
ncbi:MAG: methionyl-tRNA formyltransferase [Chloroflexota bacterium]